MVNMHYGAYKIIMTDRISTTFGSMGDTNPFTSNNTSGGVQAQEHLAQVVTIMNGQ
jgi:hypothetical protein